ncbi:MAG: molybdopterin synthase sulfur carrier subunit [Acidobacteria bacterium]|nr:MAG: molybdopterin synthase sulfur carrier subunit [Acidobacteriota bacterium]
MTIFIPTPLRSYTKEKAEVRAIGNTLADLLTDLNQQFPGIRFRMIDEQDRIRPHIKIFVNQEQAQSLSVALQENDRVIILQALSGG